MGKRHSLSKEALLIRIGEAALRWHLADEYYRHCYSNMVRHYPYVDQRRKDMPAQQERVKESAWASEVRRVSRHEIYGWALLFKQHGFSVPNEPDFCPIPRRQAGKRAKP